MPIFAFEALDSTGKEIKDVIEATSPEEAQQILRANGSYVTKLTVKKSRKAATEKKTAGKKKGFAIGGVPSKQLCMFTRQLSILQDAGLPILRSLKILEQQLKGGQLKNCLMDVCDEIESGSTLSEAMSKSPKAFDRLYVNMIRAGEAGGALEIILRRLAEFQERAQAIRRQVKGALVYPCVVVSVAVGILTFIMIKIVPTFEKIFVDFGLKLPAMTKALITMSQYTAKYWFLIPGIPVLFVLFIKLIRKFSPGRTGWDMWIIKMPIFGPLVEKNILARGTRTLGTLISSGVPILEALNITRETSGNAVYEKLYSKVSEAIRDGESIAKPMKEQSKLSFDAVCLFFWNLFIPVIGTLMYLGKMKSRIVDDLTVNMIDVGEETGELDTMLYKVADTFDDEVKVLTESLMSLMEPLMIIVLGGAVGFIVISLFLPLVKLIEGLS